MASTPTREPGALRVVVTRPAHQAGALLERISALGAMPVALPLIDITPTIDTPAVVRRMRHLAEYDWLIFVSANAADCGCKAIRAHATPPVAARIAAIGPATARTLEQHGLKVDLSPQAPSRSESLLALAPLSSVAGTRILIFRGNGGRETLRDALRERGARVDYAEVYRRDQVQTDRDALSRVLAGGPTVIVLTSVTGLDHLLALAGAELAGPLRDTPVIVVGERQARAARERGWRADVVTAASAGEDDLVAALGRWKTIEAAQHT